MYYNKGMMKTKKEQKINNIKNAILNGYTMKSLNGRQWIVLDSHGDGYDIFETKLRAENCLAKIGALTTKLVA